MSEYWVSKKQYWCQYCKIFIRDDVPSRRQHETGLRHQGNKDRFLRDIYKSGEKAVREKAEEKKMMAQIEKQAATAHANAGNSASSMSAGASSATASSSSVAPKPKTTAVNKNDKYANYSTAASLGFIDADAIVAERQKLESETRAKIGEAGTWETVAVITPSQDEDVEQDGEEDARYAYNGGDVKPSTSGILRGSLDDDPGEEARNFRFETGEAGAGPVRRVKPDVYDDGEWDPDSILALGRKVKQAVKTEGDVKVEVKHEVDTGEGQTNVAPSHTVDGAEVNEAQGQSLVTVDGEIKGEDGTTESKPAGSSMFKKRKAPGAANRSVRQKM